jgi:hypothetical protein
VSKACPEQFAEIVAFDRRMTGTRREKMLIRLFEESPIGAQVVSGSGGLAGYVTVRRGFNAIQIGPCMATPQAGPALLAATLSRCAGRPVFLDVPRDNAAALAVAERSGLTVQRHFVRMYRGTRVEDSVAAIWAGSGPEKG